MCCAVAPKAGTKLIAAALTATAVVVAGLGVVAVTPADAHHLTCLGDRTTYDGTTGSDYIVRPETGSGRDVVAARAGQLDYVYGYEGDDVLCGNDGYDIIYGGPGGDQINGGAWDDSIQGDDGNDVVRGGARHDEVYGESGNDILFDGFRDLVSGGDGYDTWYACNDGDDEYSVSGIEQRVLIECALD